MASSETSTTGQERFEVVNPDAAAIDIGSRSHYVAVSPERDPQPIRAFGCYTNDLRRMAAWLKQCGVRTIALESTGVYWVPVFELLEMEGFEVRLIDPRQLLSLKRSKKSDVQDCEWLRRLHRYGLLSAAYRPKPAVVTLRSYWRLRENLRQSCSRQIQLMHKALEQMNVQLHKAVSDVVGVTGLSIVRKIVAGEHDPESLAQLRQPGCKLSQHEFVAALSGNFRPEHVFSLKSALDGYDFFQSQIQGCDGQIHASMASMEKKPKALSGTPEPAPASKKRWSRRKNQPYFDLRSEQIRISGVDLTEIDGIDALTAQVALTECGLDVDAFPTEKHFASWLTLCPNNKTTGGVVFSRRTRPGASRLATALRLAAQSLARGKSALAAFYRRIAARAGKPKAITATARKLAILIYRALKYGKHYVDIGQAAYEQRYQLLQTANLRRHAHRLGFEIVNKHTGEILA